MTQRLALACLVCLCAISCDAFSFTDKGSQTVKLRNLQMEPSQLQLPGQHYLSFQLDLLEELDEPLELSLSIKKKVWFAWIPVPCISNLGSCTYTQACSKIVSITNLFGCPKEFIEKFGGCSCPAKVGSANVVRFPLALPSLPPTLAKFAKGDVSVVVTLRNSATKRVYLTGEILATVA